MEQRSLGLTGKHWGQLETAAQALGITVSEAARRVLDDDAAQLVLAKMSRPAATPGLKIPYRSA